MSFRKIVFVILALTLVMLTGCGKAPAPATPTAMPPLIIPGLEQPLATQPVGAATGAPVEVIPPTPSGDLYRPVDPAECQVVHDAVAAALGIRMGITEKSLSEFAAFKVHGGGCLVRGKGTGAQLDLVNTLAKIEATVAGLGWTPTDQYRIDVPVSVARGYAKNIMTMVIGISWEPVPEANCPQDYANCPVTPEQKIFKVVLVLMQK